MARRRVIGGSDGDEFGGEENLFSNPGELVGSAPEELPFLPPNIPGMGGPPTEPPPPPGSGVPFKGDVPSFGGGTEPGGLGGAGTTSKPRDITSTATSAPRQASPHPRTPSPSPAPPADSGGSGGAPSAAPARPVAPMPVAALPPQPFTPMPPPGSLPTPGMPSPIMSVPRSPAPSLYGDSGGGGGLLGGAGGLMSGGLGVPGGDGELENDDITSLILSLLAGG